MLINKIKNISHTQVKRKVVIIISKKVYLVMPEQSNDYRVVTFGSGGVGKSSLGKDTNIYMLS